jgi:hypothetical protein
MITCLSKWFKWLKWFSFFENNPYDDYIKTHKTYKFFEETPEENWMIVREIETLARLGIVRSCNWTYPWIKYDVTIISSTDIIIGQKFVSP